MSSHNNRQYRLAARPVGLPKKSDWNFVEEPARPPADGEVLVGIKYLSLDPAMRGWMNEGKSYVPAVEIGAVMRALAVGEVLESKTDQFAPGEFVSGGFGVQAFATVKAKDCTKIDPAIAPLPTYLNVLGMPGMTAYFGLLEVGLPKAGETVVVSGAAGAVGATVGQIAKIKGCRVVGIAGGAEKCRTVIEDYGFDAAVDYKTGDIRKTLKTACPDGIDVYFDNVGGEILEACLGLINRRARIVICGAISQYNATTPPKGPANYLSLLINRARMEGMIVFDYADRYGLAARDMAGWMAEGKLKGREDIVAGIETFPETLLKLFSGENNGKLVLKV
jgi:NADPH-dependent curcumin reductase CurA